jgi:Ser/Thr protein kinase RdoA (MazF antagonist)
VNRNSAPIVVEFLGVPGAGKTTLMEAARKFFHEEGFRAYSAVDAARPLAQRTAVGRFVTRFVPARFRKQVLWQAFYYNSFFYRFKFIRRQFRLYQFVLRSQWRRPPESAVRERRVLYWFHRLMGTYEFLKKFAKPGEVLVFDDGFVHRAVHLNASMVETPIPENIKTYLDLIPQPDIVIVPCTPLDVCTSRVIQRGVWKHFHNKSHEDLNQYLVNCSQVVEVTVDYIKSKGWTVIEVDNGKSDPAFAAELLRNELANLSLNYKKEQQLTGKRYVPHVLHFPRPSRLSEFVKSRMRSLDIEKETVQQVLDQFGLEITKPPSNLPLSRRTRNLMLKTTTGKKVIKRYRARHEVPTILYSHSILERLAKLNFPAPRLSATPAGETFISLESGIYAIFDFVEGNNYSLSFVPPVFRRQLMFTAGQTLGRLHHALADFMPDGCHHLGFETYTGSWRRDLAWHTTKVSEMKERSRTLQNEADKQHANWLVQNCNYILEELGKLDEKLNQSALTRVVIHGDYGLHNIVFDAKNDIVTPIDFESSRLEWRLSDLVSASSRLRYRNGAYNFESIRKLLEGYQSEYPIDAEEWHSLPFVWRFHKLRASLIYWNSYFETGGPVRKLISARDAVSQADWVMKNPDTFLKLNRAV